MSDPADTNKPLCSLCEGPILVADGPSVSILKWRSRNGDPERRWHFCGVCAERLALVQRPVFATINDLQRVEFLQKKLLRERPDMIPALSPWGLTEIDLRERTHPTMEPIFNALLRAPALPKSKRKARQA